MLKKELRKAYKIKRQELNDEELAFKSLQIANQLVNMPIWEHVYYHLFLTITEQKEVQTEFILPILLCL